jgi:ankyrin repeat protein
MTIKKIRVTLLSSICAVVLAGCGTLFNSEESANKNDSTSSNVVESKSLTSGKPTALMQAAAEGDLSELQDLVSDDNEVNTVTPEGTALSWAVEKNQQIAGLFLMSVGANPNLGFEAGTPSLLMTASKQGDSRLVKALLIAGADVNYVDAKGESAIAYASYDGHLTTVKALLKAGADVNVTPNGQSLLMHIVSNSDLLLAQVVIAAGANVNFVDEKGNSALKIAQSKKLADIEMLLVQSGAAS